MSKAEPKRSRMILDLPVEVQIAIKLQAAKRRVKTGAVIEAAVNEVYADDVQEAKTHLAAEKAEKKHG
jgi:hypothetical protein